MSIKTLVGDIDVQVKGTATKKKSDSPKREIKVDDLRYYLEHGGALYFVVYEKESSCEVYFKELLPYDIHKLLRGHSDQKTVNVRLDPFPDSPAEILSLVTQAIRDKSEQRTSAGLALCSLEEYEEKGFDFTSQKFTINVGPGETLASLAPYKRGFYQYGVDKLGQSYAIGKIENLASVAVGTETLVSSGEASFTTTFFTGEDENEGRFYQFDGFVFNLSTMTLRFDEGALRDDASLSVRLRNLRLFRELKRTGTLSVNGIAILKGATSGTAAESDALDRRIELLERIDGVLKKLRVKIDLDPSKLSERNASDLDALAQALLNGELLHRPGNKGGFCLVKLPGFSIKVILLERGNDDFEVMDILDVDTTRLTPFLVDNQGRPIAAVPSLLVQTKEELCQLGNIDAELFAHSCEQIPMTAKCVESATYRLLDMIAACDESAVCKDELLKCCEILCEQLAPFGNDEVTEVNRLQIKARAQGLDGDDHNALARLVANSESRLVKCCASILRGDVTQTNAYLEQMDDTELKELHNWPIWHLMPEEPG